MKNSIKNITLIILISFSYSFAQWEQINNGIPNVSINCLEFNNNKIYAGTDIGFYTSTNNGITWVQEGKMNQFFRINTFVSNNSQIYVGMKNQGIIQNDIGFYLYKHNQQLERINVNFIKVGDKSIMYSGTNNGFYISTNLGNSWESKNNGIENLEVFSIALIDSNCYIGTNDGVYLSSNNGNNWIKYSSNIINTNIQTLLIKDNIVFAGTKGGGIYTSNNNSKNWQSKNNGIKDFYIQTLYTNTN